MFEQLRDSLAAGESLVIMAAAALAALALFWGIAAVVMRRLDPARRRLEQMQGSSQEVGTAGLGQRIERMIRPFARFLLPRGSELEGTRQKLLFAGFKSGSALTSFYGAKLALSGTLLSVWLVATRFLPGLTSGYIMLIGLAVGF